MKFNKLLEEYRKTKSDLVINTTYLAELTKTNEDCHNVLSNLDCQPFESKVSQQRQVCINLANKISAINCELLEMIKMIDDNTIRNILTLRTLTDYTWKKIGQSCGYCESRVRQLYKIGSDILNS